MKAPLASYVADIRLTPIVSDGLQSFIARQAAVVENQLASQASPEQLRMFQRMLAMQQRFIACSRGDMAGAFEHDPEHGLRALQLVGG